MGARSVSLWLEFSWFAQRSSHSKPPLSASTSVTIFLSASSMRFFSRARSSYSMSEYSMYSFFFDESSLFRNFAISSFMTSLMRLRRRHHSGNEIPSLCYPPEILLLFMLTSFARIVSTSFIISESWRMTVLSTSFMVISLVGILEMHPSGFFPSSIMSFPCSQASKTSIHLSYVGSSRKQRGYFYIVIEALFPRKGQRNSYISFRTTAIVAEVCECRWSADTESNHSVL